MTQVRSAKSVRSSDGTNYQSVSQGNISNARSNIRKHNSMKTRTAVGGTDNLIRAMYGLDGKPMCAVAISPVIATDRIGTAHSNTYRGYHNTTAGQRRSDSTVQHAGTDVSGMSWDYIMRKCDKLDISLVEYCAMYDLPIAAIAKLAPTA